MPSAAEDRSSDAVIPIIAVRVSEDIVPHEFFDPTQYISIDDYGHRTNRSHDDGKRYVKDRESPRRRQVWL